MTTPISDTCRVVELAGSAYMADDYGEAAWRTIARFLLKEGHTVEEAAAIMLSKHARWADDSEGAGDGNRTNSAAFIRYYRHVGGPDWWRTEASELADGTEEDAWHQVRAMNVLAEAASRIIARRSGHDR